MLRRGSRTGKERCKGSDLDLEVGWKLVRKALYYISVLESGWVMMGSPFRSCWIMDLYYTRVKLIFT
jgi:hypothetical protein